MIGSELVQKYGSWALVTGASSGIGESFARVLASWGVSCLLVSNEEQALREVCDDIEAQTGTRAIALVGDLTQRDFLSRVVDAAREHRPGIVVNNAGFGMMGYLIQHEFDDYLRMLKVDEEAVLFLTHHFCRDFYRRRARGAIINVSSANADFNHGIPFSAVYSSSKAMVKQFSEAVYFEMKPFGIDILNVSPGPTRTSFQAKADTHTLIFAEPPENVVQRSFEALGRQPSVTTNPYSKLILSLHRLLPISEHMKTALRAWMFGRVLAKSDRIHLDDIERDPETS